ncbi:4677_t:CDS:1, partial [Cetraspora pellucida]
SDALYDLAANLKDALKQLEDQKSQKLDEYGEPLILEEGICSLVDDYHSEEETEDNNDF